MWWNNAIADDLVSSAGTKQQKDTPPLLSVFAWLTNLLGGAMWAIKIWPSLVGALTYVLVGRLVLHLGGRWFALGKNKRRGNTLLPIIDE